MVLKGVLASYKLGNKTLDALKAENENLRQQTGELLTSLQSHQLNANLNAEIQLDLRKEVAQLHIKNEELHCELYATQTELKSVRGTCDYLYEKNSNAPGNRFGRKVTARFGVTHKIQVTSVGMAVRYVP
uniref:Uncharacterized protein n=1 Tax=Anguilla anguilla TaxID=7936 RepID=A0A0E9UGN5_ANGAN